VKERLPFNRNNNEVERVTDNSTRKSVGSTPGKLMVKLHREKANGA
jgi:hypothetical protein